MWWVWAMPHRSPQHYRDRARELRAEAGRRTEALTRDILLHVAQQCEQMASETEARDQAKARLLPSME